MINFLLFKIICIKKINIKMKNIISIQSIIYAKGYNRQEWGNLLKACLNNEEM